MSVSIKNMVLIHIILTLIINFNNFSVIKLINKKLDFISHVIYYLVIIFFFFRIIFFTHNLTFYSYIIIIRFVTLYTEVKTCTNIYQTV